MSLQHRYRVEAGNRAVGLALELPAIRDLAAASGVSLDDGLDRLREAGLVGVAVGEETLQDLVATRGLRVAPTATGAVVSGSPESVSRVRAALRALYPVAEINDAPEASFDVLGVRPEALPSLPVGLDPVQVDAVRRAGLEVIARLSNPIGATPAYIATALGSAARQGASVFLPMGDQALGYRGCLDETAAALERTGILYASPEFARITGESALARRVTDRLVRLHSIQAGEVDKLSPGELRERFVKAFAERNVRWLYLRPPTLSDPDPLLAIRRTTSELRAALRQAGGELRTPRPFESPRVPQPLFPLIGLTVAAAAVLVGWSLFRATGIRVVGTLLVVGIGALAFLPEFRGYTAVLAAIAFPLLGYLTVLREPWPRPLNGFLAISAFSLAGGLCAAALLNGLPYLVKVEQLPMVKLSHFGPILVVGLLLAIWNGDLRAKLDAPVKWLAAGVAFALLAALAFMAIRTGNEAPGAVSALELKIRSLLDSVLPVRPRTKEVLIGHPALLLGLALQARRLSLGKAGLSGWAALLLTAGAIGQTSIVNTLCHLHTPLVPSLVRIATGLVLGALVAAALWPWVKRSEA